MVEHGHRLTSQQRKALTVRELRGEAPRVTLAKRAEWPIASERVGYWELEALQVQLEEVRRAIDGVEQSLGEVDVAATELGAGGQANAGPMRAGNVKPWWRRI